MHLELAHSFASHNSFVWLFVLVTEMTTCLDSTNLISSYFRYLCTVLELFPNASTTYFLLQCASELILIHSNTKSYLLLSRNFTFNSPSSATNIKETVIGVIKYI